MNTESALGQQQRKESVPANVAKLIGQLNAESFDARREAKDSLFDLGETAIPALTAEALERSNDTGYSAVRILSRLLKEKTGKVSDAARKSLEQIAKGDDAIARQAREALEEATDQPGRQGIGFPGGLRQAQIGNGRSTQTSIVNGAITTVAREAGRVVRITKEPDGPVSVTLTEKGQKPKKWSADSLDELKKKHPEAFKLYQEYGQDAARIRMPNMQFPPGFGALAVDPFGPMDPFDPFDPFGRMRRKRVNPQVAREFEDAEMLMDDMTNLLKSLKKKSKAPEVQQLERKLEALKRSMGRIKQQAAK